MRTSSRVRQAVRQGPSSNSYCRVSACSAAWLEGARERLPCSSTKVTAEPSVPAVVVAASVVTSLRAVSTVSRDSTSPAIWLRAVPRFADGSRLSGSGWAGVGISAAGSVIGPLQRWYRARRGGGGAAGHRHAGAGQGSAAAVRRSWARRGSGGQLAAEHQVLGDVTHLSVGAHRGVGQQPEGLISGQLVPLDQDALGLLDDRAELHRLVQ